MLYIKSWFSLRWEFVRYNLSSLSFFLENWKKSKLQILCLYCLGKHFGYHKSKNASVFFNLFYIIMKKDNGNSCWKLRNTTERNYFKTLSSEKYWYRALPGEYLSLGSFSCRRFSVPDCPIEGLGQLVILNLGQKLILLFNFWRHIY